MDTSKFAEVMTKHRNTIQTHINLLNEVDTIEKFKQMNDSFIALMQETESVIAYMDSLISYLDDKQIKSNLLDSGECYAPYLPHQGKQVNVG